MLLASPLTVSVKSEGDDQIIKITDEMPFVVKTGANTCVDLPIPVRVFRVSLKRSLCQLPDVVSYLLNPLRRIFASVSLLRSVLNSGPGSGSG